MVNLMKYIKIDNKIYIYEKEINENTNINDLKLNHLYSYNDYLLIYKGKYSEIIEEPGIYYDEDQSIILLYDDEINLKVSDLIVLDLSESLFKKNLNMQEVLDNLPKSDEVVESRNKLIHFDINPNDDKIVIKLKEAVNDAKINFHKLYNAFSDDRDAYNLYRGLLIRNNTTSKSIEKWMEIIDVDIFFN